MRRRLLLAATCAVAAVATLLPLPAGAATEPSSSTSSTAPSASAAAGSLAVQPSVGQVAVTGAGAGSAVALRDGAGRTVARRDADQRGSVLFRDVKPGAGYVVRVGNREAAPISVADPRTTPPATTYTSQRLGAGYGYLTTRDGTKLAVNVKLPGPVDGGPYPTVVEYSGYDPANPDGTQPASQLAQLLGYATVGVNLRGTGCSGGAYDYFEQLQSLDGYDVIETVAAQPWVANGAVGMVGISFPGITQLFVAQTRPPHLAAITPLSVLDDTYDTLYPGGIFNDGFGLTWAKDRQHDAEPSTESGGGQAWASKRIRNGDTTCAANQALRLQATDVDAQLRSLRYRSNPTADSLAPDTFVKNIDVPVFLAGAWQDQETGSHFADMVDDFSPTIPLKVTLMNGIHQDSLAPAVLSSWIEFLDFYVARKIPSIPPLTRALATNLLPQVFGKGATLAPDRFTDQPDYATALRAYAAEPKVKVLFDVGAGSVPMPSFSTSGATFPLPNTTATTWYLGADGTLTPTAPSASGSAKDGADRFDDDPSQLPRTMQTLDSGISPKYGWKPVPKGDGLGYVTEPLARDTVLAGTGSVDLWVTSSKPDADLEVTISEVRPDGQETYVQSGWLRASQRALDTKASTELLPVQTHAKDDVAALPAGKPTLVRVPLYPFAHAFRAGSRIRIVVQPPGGNRPHWAFATLPGSRTVTVSRTAAQPSKVVLPVVGGVDVSSPLPTCDTLRGQPCRPYVPLNN